MARTEPSSIASAHVRADAHASDRCVVPLREPPRSVPPGPAPACPRDPEDGGPKLAVAEVAFEEAGAKVTVELARTEHERARGLMYRTALADDRGMLFDMQSRRVQAFWMRNTCIPLDMMFIDDDGLIVGIEENVPTLNDEERSVPCPSSWVLEVNAGWSRRHGIKPGQHVRLPRS